MSRIALDLEGYVVTRQLAPPPQPPPVCIVMREVHVVFVRPPAFADASPAKVPAGLLPSRAPQTLRPVASGSCHRIASAPVKGLVRSDLAAYVESILDRIARERGFTAEKPLEVVLSRGLARRPPAHDAGRSLDIAGVGGKSIAEWKREWDDVEEHNAEERDKSRERNLGFALCKAFEEAAGTTPAGGAALVHGPWSDASSAPEQVDSHIHVTL